MEDRRVLGIDLETYSAAAIKSVGSFKYIDDPTFEIMLFGFAWDDGPVEVIDLMNVEDIPTEILDALTDPTVTKTAWNCAFERECLRKYTGQEMPPEQWQDSMILAAVCGLPMSLGGAGKALGLPEDSAKDKAGKALIRFFCSPCRPTKANGGRTRNLPEHDPEKWAQFIEYNRQDVVAERTIRNMLKRWTPDETEHKFWCLDADINGRGMRVDLPMVRHAIQFDNKFKADLTEQAIALTGMENPNSISQIKQWLLDQEGIEVPSLNKKVVADVVSKLSTDRAREFMAMRKKLAKSSTKKYEAMERAACSDEHIKGMFQFYGASRTGRFAGRLVQLQNLYRNEIADLDTARQLVREGDYDTFLDWYGDVSGTLSELVRTALVPEPGHKLIVADFSAIEARVLAWLAGEQWVLEAFREGKDIYCETASQMFGVPVVKHGENGHLRGKGKTAVLGCGYGGGINALKNFGADKMMTDEAMVETVDLWREANPHIVKMWKTIEKAAVRCVVKRTPTKDPISGTRFDLEKGTLWMTLPSGRRIAYPGAEYGESKWKNGKALSYMGSEQQTKKWCRIETWGGKLVENLTQATARDCLRDAMLALDAAGFVIRAHVHDEVIISEPINGRSVDEVCEIMGRELPWAQGLPLKAAGYECAYYMKD